VAAGATPADPEGFAVTTSRASGTAFGGGVTYTPTTAGTCGGIVLSPPSTVPKTDVEDRGASHFVPLSRPDP
jgi:hypothetical protein